ncbi:MAG: aminoglycoside phosphotransferase family protein, partial [Sphingobacteriaceae bacterium]
KNAAPTRKEKASSQIKIVLEHVEILKTYQKIIQEKQVPLRVMHHDTKISNVLFNNAGKSLCMVDLDTVMPGYFLSDLGDMMRTYLSPASEEETDLNRIIIRPDFYQAIIHGYLSEMETVLTSAEKQYFFYAGKMMMYMQGLRFLTDFLIGDIYYPVTYPDQNLFRAKNQFTLLKRFMLMENRLTIL